MPDLENRIVAAGAGDGSERITIARSADDTFAVMYIPADGRDVREFTLNLAAFPGNLTAHWFNPAKDEPLLAVESPLRNLDGQMLRTPGDNRFGANDWVLVWRSNP